MLNSNPVPPLLYALAFLFLFFIDDCYVPVTPSWTPNVPHSLTQYCGGWCCVVEWCGEGVREQRITCGKAVLALVVRLLRTTVLPDGLLPKPSPPRLSPTTEQQTLLTRCR